MNPTTLRRVYDNELRLTEDVDTLTLPELLDTVTANTWNELEQPCPDARNERKPMITSLRRNLQREHLERLLDLVLEDSDSTAAYKPIGNLARLQLQSIKAKIEKSLKTCEDKMDSYSKAHLAESDERIKRALEASYTYQGKQAMMPMSIIRIGSETDSEK